MPLISNPTDSDPNNDKWIEMHSRNPAHAGENIPAINAARAAIVNWFHAKKVNGTLGKYTLDEITSYCKQQAAVQSILKDNTVYSDYLVRRIISDQLKAYIDDKEM